LSIAPTVVRGSLAISAALPIAFAPVATAVTVAFTNVVAALGTAEQYAVMQASRDTVASALHDALTSIAPVVQQVADDIGDALASAPIQDIGPPKASSAPRARSATSGQASTRNPAHSVAKAGSARATDKRVAHSARR
jgi:hypothetical protein